MLLNPGLIRDGVGHLPTAFASCIESNSVSTTTPSTASAVTIAIIAIDVVDISRLQYRLVAPSASPHLAVCESSKLEDRCTTAKEFLTMV